MKTKWEFLFKAWDITFAEDHQFNGTLKIEQDEPIAVEIRIDPIKDISHPDCDELGQIVITLPGMPEENKAYAYSIALLMKDRISFPNARVQFLGLVYRTKIPQNHEEEQDAEANQTCAEMTLVEKTKAKLFDPKRISFGTVSNQSALLMQQFNSAKNMVHPVERFMALFKILEKAYTEGRSGNVANLLIQSEDLFTIVRSILHSPKSSNEPLTKDEYVAFIKLLLKIRDNCAHWRNKTGYSRDDYRIGMEVEPNLIALQLITQKVIEHAV